MTNSEILIYNEAIDAAAAVVPSEIEPKVWRLKKPIPEPLAPRVCDGCCGNPLCGPLHSDRKEFPAPSEDLTEDELGEIQFAYSTPTTRLIRRLIAEVKRRRGEKKSRKDFVDSTVKPFAEMDFGCDCDECRKSWSEVRHFVWSMRHVFGKCPRHIHRESPQKDAFECSLTAEEREWMRA